MASSFSGLVPLQRQSAVWVARGLSRILETEFPSVCSCSTTNMPRNLGRVVCSEPQFPHLKIKQYFLPCLILWDVMGEAEMLGEPWVPGISQTASQMSNPRSKTVRILSGKA